jgi:hypothetical protein
MKTATCLACGRSFESAGTLGEVIAAAQGATPDELKNMRARDEQRDAESGGARGVCSVQCAIRRALRALEAKS